MNKIFVEDINEKDFYLKEDTVMIIKNINKSINIKTSNPINIFILLLSSKIDIQYNTGFNSCLNIFSVNSSPNINIYLEKDDITFNYFYSTINNTINEYKIDINHLGNNIKSKIVNHGLNTEDDKLSFIINTIVPKKYTGIKTSQNSKIIVLKDNNATIKPNLLIDNDDIEADHSAYIGRFNEDEIFYLMTRGITKNNAIDLLIKSFLIGDMNISYEERELILNNIKKYWR